MPKTRIPGLLAGLVAASIWGGMYVVSKVILEVIPPFTLLSLRLVLGAVSLGSVLLFLPPASRRVDRAGAVFLVGLIGYGVSLGLQFIGTRLSTASNGALVTSATPAFVALFAPFLLGERNTLRRVLALVVATLGVTAVIDPRTAELSPATFQGNLALFGAGLTWALYSVLVRKIAGAGALLASSTIMLLGGLPVSLPLAAWELSSEGMGAITVGVVAGLLFLGIISTALAMFLWNYAFAVLPAGVASLTFFAQPVVGTLLGWAFLGERITPLFLLGGVLIGVGLAFASRLES